jgi:hypothetical protein
MTVSGKYVGTFVDATHALPDGMHMSADYPFMLPKIVDRTAGTITIQGRRGVKETLSIRHDARGREFCELAQSSTFERLYNRPPTTFKLLPFKEEKRHQ